MSENETKRASLLGTVIRSYFGYRFKITSTQNNYTLGTGFFKSDTELSKEEQINFLHQYTNGIYLSTEPYINIDILKQTHN